MQNYHQMIVWQDFFLKAKNVCKRTAELYLLCLLVLAAFPADSALMADKLEIIQWGENMKRKDLAHRPIEKVVLKSVKAAKVFIIIIIIMQLLATV